MCSIYFVTGPNTNGSGKAMKGSGFFLGKNEKPQGRKCTLRLEREIAN